MWMILTLHCHINIGFRFSRLLWLTHHDVCSSYLAGFQRKEYHLCISLMMMAYSFHCFPILLLHFATHWQDPVDPLGECSQTCCFLSVQPEEGKGKDAHFLVFMSSTLLTSIQFLVNKLREYNILTKKLNIFQLIYLTIYTLIRQCIDIRPRVVNNPF